MGLFDVKGVDKDTLRELLNEAFTLYGTNAELYEQEDSSQNSIGDETFERGKPVKISILFEENPKAKLIKWGWMVEGMETPILAYILPKSVDGSPVVVRRGALVKVPYVSEDDSYRDLFVGEVKTDSLNNLCWICMLTQNRVQKLVNPTTEQEVKELDIAGNNFFKGTTI
jgi:hypothetical protein